LQTDLSLVLAASAVVIVVVVIHMNGQSYFVLVVDVQSLVVMKSQMDH
jgi:hypothetical protein